MSVESARPQESPATRAAAAAFFVGGSIFLWLATIAWPLPAQPDLDPGWQQILVDAWLKGLRFGHDLVFTWGPLGFPLSIFYLPEALDAKLRFEMVGRLAFSVICIAVAWPLSPVRRLAWVGALVLFSYNLFDAVAVAVIPAIAATWLLAARSYALPILGIVALAAFALVKFTLLTLVAAVTGVVTLLMLIDGQPRRAVLIPIGMAVAVAALWLIAGQRLEDFPIWIRLSLDIASGYPAAMGLEPTRPFLLAGVLVAAAHAFWLVPALWSAPSQRHRLVLVGLVVAPLIVAWKHGFTRADLHVTYAFMTSLLVALLAPAIAGPSRWTRQLTLLPVLASVLAFEIVTPGTLVARPSDAWGRVRRATYWITDLDGFAADFRRRFGESAAAARLPDAVLEQIGDQEVDLIGYSQGLLHLNGLNHRTRPVIQSYSAYTPFLAERDRLFLASDDAPAYLIASLETIDGRYPAQDDARLLAELPRRYAPVFDEPRGVLLRRRETQPLPVALDATRLLERDLAPGEPLELPTQRDAAQWVEIEATPTPIGRLLGLVLAPPPLMMTTRDDSGAAVTTRVLPGLAPGGFLIQPRLLGPSDLVAFVNGKGRRWNTALTLAPGPRDSWFWRRFRVRLFRVSDLPLRAEGLVDLGISNVEPHRIASRHPWEPRQDDSGQRLFLHAPGELELPVPAGARQLSGGFGFEPGAYTAGGHTDGAEFVIEARTSDGQTVLLWRRLLNPAVIVDDRGRLHFQIALPSATLSTIRVTTRPGPADNDNWDWTYVAELRIQ